MRVHQPDLKQSLDLNQCEYTPFNEVSYVYISSAESSAIMFNIEIQKLRGTIDLISLKWM